MLAKVGGQTLKFSPHKGGWIYGCGRITDYDNDDDDYDDDGDDPDDVDDDDDDNDD